jgi:hypothetical protein
MRWKPLSLVVSGFLMTVAVVMIFSLISGVIAAAILGSSSSSFSSRAEGAAAFGVVATLTTFLVAYVLYMLFFAAATKMCYELTLSEKQIPRRESLRFALRNIGAVTVTPLILFISVGGVLLGEWVLFLLGQIDFLGPILTGLAFAPITAVNIGLILAAYYGVWLLFISVASGATGIGETTKKTWSLVRTSYRTLIPELLSLTLVQMLVLIIGVGLLLVGIYFTTVIAAAAGVGGTMMTGVLSGGIDKLVKEALLGSSSYGGYGRSARSAAAGWLFGLMAFGLGMALLFGFVQAFSIVFFLNGCSRIYDRTEKSLGKS